MLLHCPKQAPGQDLPVTSLLPPVHTECGKHILTVCAIRIITETGPPAISRPKPLWPSLPPPGPTKLRRSCRQPKCALAPRPSTASRDTMAGPHPTLMGFRSQFLCWEADDRIPTPGPEPAPSPRLPPFLRGQGSHTTDPRTPGSQLPLLIFKLGN